MQSIKKKYTNCVGINFSVKFCSSSAVGGLCRLNVKNNYTNFVIKRIRISPPPPHHKNLIISQLINPP